MKRMIKLLTLLTAITLALGLSLIPASAADIEPIMGEVDPAFGIEAIMGEIEPIMGEVDPDLGIEAIMGEVEVIWDDEFPEDFEEWDGAGEAEPDDLEVLGETQHVDGEIEPRIGIEPIMGELDADGDSNNILWIVLIAVGAGLLGIAVFLGVWFNGRAKRQSNN